MYSTSQFHWYNFSCYGRSKLPTWHNKSSELGRDFASALGHIPGSAYHLQHTTNCRWEFYQMLANCLMWSASFSFILKHSAYLQAKGIIYYIFLAIVHFWLPISILKWAMLCYSNKQRHTFNDLKKRSLFSFRTTKLIMKPAGSIPQEPVPVMPPPGTMQTTLRGTDSSGRHNTDNHINCPQSDHATLRIISQNQSQDCKEKRTSEPITYQEGRWLKSPFVNTNSHHNSLLEMPWATQPAKWPESYLLSPPFLLFSIQCWRL